MFLSQLPHFSKQQEYELPICHVREVGFRFMAIMLLLFQRCLVARPRLYFFQARSRLCDVVARVLMFGSRGWLRGVRIGRQELLEVLHYKGEYLVYLHVVFCQFPCCGIYISLSVRFRLLLCDSTPESSR